MLRLSINYRTPVALMDPAAAVILAARPDVQVPEAIRTDGRPLVVVRLGDEADLVAAAVTRAAALLDGEGTAGVVLHPARPRPAAPEGITWYAPEDLQGLEMDVVVIVRADRALVARRRRGAEPVRDAHPGDTGGGAAALPRAAGVRAAAALAAGIPGSLTVCTAGDHRDERHQLGAAARQPV